MMQINGTVSMPVVSATIGFTKVYIHEDDEATRTKLYNWMLAEGYAVTDTMTIKQLVDVLVGEETYKYEYADGYLIVTDTMATVIGTILNLVHGCSVTDNILVLEDS